MRPVCREDRGGGAVPTIGRAGAKKRRETQRWPRGAGVRGEGKSHGGRGAAIRGGEAVRGDKAAEATGLSTAMREVAADAGVQTEAGAEAEKEAEAEQRRDDDGAMVQRHSGETGRWGCGAVEPAAENQYMYKIGSWIRGIWAKSTKSTNLHVSTCSGSFIAVQ